MEEDSTFPIDFDMTADVSKLNRDNSQVQLNDKESLKEMTSSYSLNEAEPRPRSRNGTVREQENMISELKKECFGLKMRIFYMEERLSESYDATTQDILKNNIELKVTIEQLKMDNESKSELLAKASHAMDQLTSHSNDRQEEQRACLAEGLLQAKSEAFENLSRELFKVNQALVEEQDRNSQQTMHIESLTKALEAATCNQEDEKGAVQHENERLQKALDDIKDGFEALKAKKKKDEEALESVIKEMEETVVEKEKCIEELRNGKVVASSRCLQEFEVEKQKLETQYRSQVQELEASLNEKAKELADKEKTLSIIREEKLNSSKERMKYELETLKTKESMIVELEVKLKESEYKLVKTNELVEAKNQDIQTLKEESSQKETTSNENKRKFANELKRLKKAFGEEMAREKVECTQHELAVQKRVTELEELCEKVKEEKLKESEKLKVMQRECEHLKEENKGMSEFYGKKMHDANEKCKNLEKLHTRSVEEKHNVLADFNQQFANTEIQLKAVNEELEKAKANKRETESYYEMKLNNKDVQIEKLNKRKDNEHIVEGLVEKLENLFAATEEEKSRCSRLVDQLINNEHPESQKKVLELTMIEMERLRKTLLSLFKSIMHDLPWSAKNVLDMSGLDKVPSIIEKDSDIRMLHAKLMCKEKDEARDQKTISNLQKEIGSVSLELSVCKEEKEAILNKVKTSQPQVESNEKSPNKQQLKNDLKELCNINKRLRNKLKDITQTHDLLKAKNSELKLSHLQVDDERHKLQVRISEEISLSEQLRNEIEHLKVKESEQLTAELLTHRNLSSQLEDSVEQVKSLVVERNQLRTELYSANSKNEELLAHSKHQVENFEAILAKKSDEVVQLNKEIENGSMNLNTARDLIESLNTKISSLQTQNNELKACLMKANVEDEQLTRLQEELQNLRNTRNCLENRIKEINEAASLMKEKCSLTEEENTAKDKHIVVLSQQVLHLEEQLESFSPIHTSSQHNIALSSDAFTQTKEEMAADNVTLHIEEMRRLRRQLEATVDNNDTLKRQLKERLFHVEKDVQGIHDPLLRVNLVRDNDVLRAELLAVENLKQDFKIVNERLKNENQSQKLAIEKLQGQLRSLNELTVRLKLEMDVYDRLVNKAGLNKHSTTAAQLDDDLISALLQEIRDLREQLCLSMKANNHLREKLECQLGQSLSPSVESGTRRALFSVANELPRAKSLVDYASPDETPTKDNDDTSTLTSSNPGSSLLQLIKKMLALSASVQLKLKLSSSPQIVVVCGEMKQVDQLLHETKQLVTSLLPVHSTEKDEMQKKVARLKKSLLSKEKFIKSTLDMIENNILWKENMDESLKNKLMKARDTLKETKGNLQNKAGHCRSVDSSRESTLSSLDYQ